ncbi:MAG: imidazoleglycerol-phosphate dehydratase HisB [Chloroflexi bacterium]|nr:imidazoleglycerol-phosphate dehydratase HisB [Chloroflexota bacterium]
MVGESRTATVRRTTSETSVEVELNLDGQGHAEVATGIGFLDHMLDSLARHALFDVRVRASGDLQVDEHHTAEDVAIALGRALDQALGERRGIRRIAHAYAPLDEALALAVVDAGGRGYAVVEADFGGRRIGTLDGDLVRHFVETLARESRCTIHARVFCGTNDHHRAEALVKALARALDAATSLDPRRGDVPSTKGTLTE